VVNAYTLTFGGLLLLGGRLADLAGQRRAAIAGLGLFALTSLLGGLAQNQGELIAARAVQGVSGAVLLGGVLTQYLDWRWVLFVNVPIAAAMPLAAASVPAERTARRAWLGMAGAVLATASMAVLVYAVVRTDTYAWGSPQTLGGLAAAVVLGGAFVLVEQRSAVLLVRRGILRARSLSVACLVIFLMACAQFGAFYFASLYVQGVLRFSPVQTGLAFVPFSLGVIAGTIAAGALMRRAGHRPPLVTVAATVTSH